MSISNERYRHEYKYPISDTEAAVLKMRLKGLMKLDSHVGPTGMYEIASLYFDDYYDSCYYENENGTDPREKFRIRIYNGNTDRISLECKRKERNKTLKTSCALNADDVERIMQGIPLEKKEENNPVLLKFIELQHRRGLKPKVIVDYKRVPYIYKAGNVRVTFDSELSSSACCEQFLEGDYFKRPIMPKGNLLLEVKFDEFLPDYLYDAMQLNNLTQTAFSKYYLCRKFN